MPTQIHNPRQGARERYFARQSTYRLAEKTKSTEVLRAPWMGWVPDLPPHMTGWRGYRDGQGLIAAPHGSRGMFMRHDDGFERADPDRLPLGRTAVGPPTEAPGQHAITMLGQYFDATNRPNRIAIVAGNPTTNIDIAMYRMNPGTGQWLIMTTGAGTIPEGSREALWDHCVFPFGAVTRGPAAANAITGPVMIMCNADHNGPVDRVLVTPEDAVGAQQYDELQKWAVLPGANFGAASCESFNGRVHFLNTEEGAAATHYPQRHRWTAIGTADPDETIVGSGWLDLAEFQRQGRRIESMQDKLVLYFEDGVAFQVPTGFYADAYRPQIVSRSRGLVGGQALCAITPHLHFGIFNDGWWTLDSSGRWSKVGRIILEETRGKSHEVTKWEESFYEELDFDYKHRTICTYDRYREMVRIAYPSKSETGSETYRILNYHPATDSCWRDRYNTPTTAWGLFDLQTTAGLTWDASVGTWNGATGTWDSYAAQYQDEVVVHGNGPTVQDVTFDGGLVFGRDPSLITYDNVSPSYFYQTHAMNRNENPLLRQTFHRFGVEYVNIGGSHVQVVVDTDELTNFQTQAIPLNEGNFNTVQNGYAHFRLDGAEHKFSLYGTGPVLIRSLVPELMLYTSDDREGQV